MIVMSMWMASGATVPPQCRLLWISDGAYRDDDYDLLCSRSSRNFRPTIIVASPLIPHLSTIVLRGHYTMKPLTLLLLIALLIAFVVSTQTSPIEARKTSPSRRATEEEEEEEEEDSKKSGKGSGSGGGGEKTDKETLDEMLRESDVLMMFEKEQKQHDKRLKELHTRMERELASVQEHFEQLMAKLKTTEEQLETNLKNVEKSLANRLTESRKEVEVSSGTWKLPFFILIVMIGGVAAFFGSLYRKATKHQRLM